MSPKQDSRQALAYRGILSAREREGLDVITAKALKRLDLGGLTRPETSTFPERLLNVPSMSSERLSNVDTASILSNITEVSIKSCKEIILESLALFPLTGLSGGSLYGFVKTYYRSENLKVPERDTIHNLLRRLAEGKELKREKKDSVWWYLLVT